MVNGQTALRQEPVQVNPPLVASRVVLLSTQAGKRFPDRIVIDSKVREQVQGGSCHLQVVRRNGRLDRLEERTRVSCVGAGYRFDNARAAKRGLGDPDFRLPGRVD